MIKIFSGKWRGVGQKDDRGLFAQIDFSFRDVLHHFQGAKLAVFMAIALHSDENGLAWPSYDLLEKETGYRRDTIARALNDLCETEIDGQRVLMRYRERDASGRYIGSNRYLIFPTDGELASEIVPESEILTVDDSQSPKIPTLENTNSGNSDLKNNHKDKDNHHLSNREGLSADHHRTDAKKAGDVIDGMLRYSGNHADLSDYPEEVRPILQTYCDLWMQNPPRKSKKGGEYALWIDDARMLRQAGGDKAIEALKSIKTNPYEWMRSAMIGRPGALIKAVRARAGELSEREKSDWTPEDGEEMRQKIRMLKAERDARLTV